jgi:hypothetical protein
LIAGVAFGITMMWSMPSLTAAIATPCAWFPAEHVTIPMEQQCSQQGRDTRNSKVSEGKTCVLFLLCQISQFVVSPSQLKGEYGLEVLSFQQNVVFAPGHKGCNDCEG